MKQNIPWIFSPIFLHLFSAVAWLPPPRKTPAAARKGGSCEAGGRRPQDQTAGRPAGIGAVTKKPVC